MTKTLRFLAWGLVGLACIGALVLAYSVWDERQLVSSLKPSVKLASIHLSTVLEAETVETHMTFGEYFKKSEDSISAIDTAIVTVKSHASAPLRRAEAEALAYMTASQDLIRALNAKARTRLDVKNDLEQMQINLDDLRSDNEYTRKRSQERSDKDSGKATDDIAQLRKKSEESQASCEATRSLAPGIAHRFGADAAVDIALFDNVIGTLKKTLGTK